MTILKEAARRALGHWKTSAIGATEGGSYIAITQTMSQDPEVQKWAMAFAAIRFLIGLLSRDGAK